MHYTSLYLPIPPYPSLNTLYLPSHPIPLTASAVILPILFQIQINVSFLLKEFFKWNDVRYFKEHSRVWKEIVTVLARFDIVGSLHIESTMERIRRQLNSTNSTTAGEHSPSSPSSSSSPSSTSSSSKSINKELQLHGLHGFVDAQTGEVLPFVHNLAVHVMQTFSTDHYRDSSLLPLVPIGMTGSADDTGNSSSGSSGSSSSSSGDRSRNRSSEQRLSAADLEDFLVAFNWAAHGQYHYLPSIWMGLGDRYLHPFLPVGCIIGLYAP